MGSLLPTTVYMAQFEMNKWYKVWSVETVHTRGILLTTGSGKAFLEKLISKIRGTLLTRKHFEQSIKKKEGSSRRRLIRNSAWSLQNTEGDSSASIICTLEESRSNNVTGWGARSLVEVVLYGQHSFYIDISLLEYFVGLLMKIMGKKFFFLNSITRGKMVYVRKKVTEEVWISLRDGLIQYYWWCYYFHFSLILT